MLFIVIEFMYNYFDRQTKEMKVLILKHDCYVKRLIEHTTQNVA